MQSIRVDLGERSYDVAIGAGSLSAAGEFLAARAEAKHVVLITDENVHLLHARRAAEAFSLRDIETDVLVIPPGEASKSLEMAITLWQSLLDLEADRRTVIVAVGGGVVGDLAGFAAATFARGLRFLQLPTSLIAQVDSAVGGKMGINMPGAKNIIGAFHQPIGVLIDVETLATLPDREYRAGLAEVVKYGAALDAELFAYLEQNAAAILERKQDVLLHVITRCCRLKAEIVERDERDESGVRAALNFGHTFGHALEMVGRGAGDGGQGAGMSGQGAGVGGRRGERGEGRGERKDASDLPSPADQPAVGARRGAGGEGDQPPPQSALTLALSGHHEVVGERGLTSEPRIPEPRIPESRIPESPNLPSPVPRPLLHGEAVAVGMVVAARLAERIGRVDAAYTARLSSLLSTFGLPTSPPAIDPRRIMKLIRRDKKSARGRPQFVLPSRLGGVEQLDTIAASDVRAILGRDCN
jgi:3-dehydroquinate synthetase